jgi:hypothetical protein
MQELFNVLSAAVDKGFVTFEEAKVLVKKMLGVPEPEPEVPAETPAPEVTPEVVETPAEVTPEPAVENL